MKYIQKDEPPIRLTQWKQKLGLRTPNWKSFPQAIKNEVYEGLLKEQGYICCYCGRPISRRECHIEHFRPKSVYKELTFEYTNLIASCQGEDEDRPRTPVHCGHKKHAWFSEELMVSPLQEDCADYFKYSGFGEILPTEDKEKEAAAKETIRRLALHIDKLVKLRRAAIDAALLVSDGLSDDEINQLARGYEQRDNDGRFTPFSSVITYMLRQLVVVKS
jgi:uncharacterized protein (TIGR02646 family)